MSFARVNITSDLDILTARQAAREFAAGIGATTTEQTLLASAISEISRNIISYAQRGEITLKIIVEDGRPGVFIIARDEGPGIADVPLAMQDGFSTSQSLGVGLPGTRRVVDEFEIETQVGKGTTIKMKKWGRRA
jgi:serine/threonine-protein kinase RsbT